MSLPGQPLAVTRLAAFSRAANALADLWVDLEHDDPLNQVLTAHYPSRAMPMSFDEVAAESTEWAHQVAVSDGRTLTDLHGPPEGPPAWATTFRVPHHPPRLA
jgi:hypothetical protein